MKYILVTGAPGSKWSSVVKNIYWSKSIDHSDYSTDREYRHDADTPGISHLMHIGAYWDPGMEFETDNWDGPFIGSGIRIVKSHTFAHQLNELKDTGHPIILVYRNDYECINWWIKCGEFNITYPLYNDYYKDLINMWEQIKLQNRDILDFLNNNNTRISRIQNNLELCNVLGITSDGVTSEHQYFEKDVHVYVYK